MLSNMSRNWDKRYIKTETDRQQAMRVFDSDAVFEVWIREIDESEYRSGLQNRSLHKGLRNAGDALAARGITKQVAYSEASKNHIFLADEHDAKEIFRAMCKALFGIDSTAKIPMDKMSEAWEKFSFIMSERLNVDVGDFPSVESMRRESLLNE